MMEQVDEALHRGVAVVATPVAGELRQMQRQRPVGSEQAEEMHQEPAGPSVRAGLVVCEGRRRMADRRLLP